MAAELTLRVGVVGAGPETAILREVLAGIDAFEVVPADEHPAPDVVVLVHDALSESRTQLAALREHGTAPIVLATSSASNELVRWALDTGIADVLTLPTGPEAALFSIEKAARTALRDRKEEQARVVTVFSPKGGSGKSVVSTNLAAAAAEIGRKRTLLIDLDLQFGDSAIMLGLQPRSTVRELIGTPSELDAEKLEVYTELHETGLRVLPAPMTPEDAELVSEDAIRALLNVARDSYDVVVVDTAPFFYGPMLATLDLTDELLVLCNPDVPTLKNVRLALKTLELLSFPEERLRIVLNRASSAMGLERGDVEAALERKVDYVLPLDTGVPLAVNQATPAVLGKSAPAFTPAMLDLARAATGGDWNTAAPSTRAGRIFSFGRN
ncbi:MAG TPA: AAA family ATPase [Gaiellaceae bacterium]|nr:AAA family ATPase [Gaiellaceae bacterium]